MMNIKKLVAISLLSCMALCLYAVEYSLSYWWIMPGAKLGLANTVTIMAIYIMGRKEAFCVLSVRIILSALLFGHPVSLMYSAAGGFLSFLVVSVLSLVIGESECWSLGVFSAFAHNMGQLILAYFVIGNINIMYYFLWMILISVVCGLFTGICAGYCIKLFKKTRMYKNSLK